MFDVTFILFAGIWHPLRDRYKNVDDDTHSPLVYFQGWDTVINRRLRLSIRNFVVLAMQNIHSETGVKCDDLSWTRALRGRDREGRLVLSFLVVSMLLLDRWWLYLLSSLALSCLYNFASFILICGLRYFCCTMLEVGVWTRSKRMKTQLCDCELSELEDFLLPRL